jgi:hypothetical protein
MNSIINFNSIKNDVNDFFHYNKEYSDYLNEINKSFYFSFKNMNVYVLYRENKDKINIEHIKKVIKRVYIISQFIPKTINIYLLLSPFEKYFNDDIKKPLDIINCNSAFTYLNRCDIYILRYEEYPKVLMHELIHHIKNIHSSFKLENINRLKSYFKINNSNLDPNEAIVELWATILHIYQISIEYNKDFYELFLMEIIYSLFKCYQLREIQKQMPNGIWNDNTNIYCYIIFKTIFMYNLNEFQKIYTYPYNDDLLTDFLIKYAKTLKTVINNPCKKRTSNKLCFMIYSDY